MSKLNLMKGDWVKVKNSDHLTNVQVDGFIGDSIFTKEAEYESEEINIEDVEPIVITHELLEQIGFTVRWHENHWKNKEWDSHIIVPGYRIAIWPAHERLGSDGWPKRFQPKKSFFIRIEHHMDCYYNNGVKMEESPLTEEMYFNDIDNLHELQHALESVGAELEIKL